jgi:hypothetical protein
LFIRSQPTMFKRFFGRGEEEGGGGSSDRRDTQDLETKRLLVIDADPKHDWASMFEGQQLEVSVPGIAVHLSTLWNDAPPQDVM